MEERRKGKDEPITRGECQYAKEICYKNNIKPIMDKIEKIDEKVEKIQIKLASLPEELATKLDERYASKEEAANTAQAVEELKDNQKWVVRTILGVIIVALLGLLIKG